MSTIYLLEDGTKISKDGGKFIITKHDGQKTEFPSGYAECIVVLGKAQITYDVIVEILRDNRSIIYLNRDGSILGTLGSKDVQGRVYLSQLEAYNNPERRITLARKIVGEKIKEQKNLLNSYNKRLLSQELDKTARKLVALIKLVDKQQNINKLMGIEGLAARTYFECFAIISNKSVFSWNGRKKNPAPDPINCMLSYAYTLLEKDVRIALAEYCLLPEIGFLHNLNFRKDSLVYDLMEPFRPALADRVVLKAINRKQFTEDDFIINDNRCYFSDEARRRFIQIYEEEAGEFDNDNRDFRTKIKEFVRKMVAELRKKDDTLIVEKAN